eukprot:11908940-Alexandrium_andersonii.AAC.1
MSAQSGRSRQPKGRKKDVNCEETGARGGVGSIPYSNDKAHLRASQGQKKFHANTEVFAKTSPEASRTSSEER